VWLEQQYALVLELEHFENNTMTGVWVGTNFGSQIASTYNFISTGVSMLVPGTPPPPPEEEKKKKSSSFWGT